MAKPPITIDLEKPLIGHGPPIKQLLFREPGWTEYMKIGEAFAWIPRGEDMVYPAPIHDNIKAYAESCLVEPKDVEMLAQVGLKDAKKITDAFVRFFRAAEPGSAASTPSSGNSSETPAGEPQTSTT